jgi:hypothetical protein
MKLLLGFGAKLTARERRNQRESLRKPEDEEETEKGHANG